MSTSTSIEDESLLSSLSPEQIDATWEHAIQNNLASEWKTQEAQQRLLSEKWPEECILSTLRSASTTSRRGKRPRAYPRKGIVKLKGDLKASKVKIGLHQLAAWKSTGHTGKKSDQASHWKCDNEACINPDHITWESSEANTTRFCCKIYHHIKNYLCPHQPTCPNCKSCFE